MDRYIEAATRLRAALTVDPDMKALIRYATLAANGHNTQPWRFAIRDIGVSILPDFTRCTPVVDPDDHHLFISLGCAAENFLIAAAAHGRAGAVTFESDAENRILIDLKPTKAKGGALYEAIPKRQSTRSDFSGQGVAPSELKRLEAAAKIDGVSVLLITDEVQRRGVKDFVIAGNGAQMDNPAFVRELKDWIRFNPAEALRTGDGLFSACSAKPFDSRPGSAG